MSPDSTGVAHYSPPPNYPEYPYYNYQPQNYSPPSSSAWFGQNGNDEFPLSPTGSRGYRLDLLNEIQEICHLSYLTLLEFHYNEITELKI